MSQSGDPTEIEMRAGVPFARVIRITDAANVWLNLDDLEVRCQMRRGPRVVDTLVWNLHDFMAPSFDGDDLLITWSMVGADTRALYAAETGSSKTGFADLVVSDVGESDARAIRVPLKITVAPTTTSAAGAA